MKRSDLGDFHRSCLFYQRETWLTLGVIRFAAVQLGGGEALLAGTDLKLV